MEVVKSEGDSKRGSGGGNEGGRQAGYKRSGGSKERREAATNIKGRKAAQRYDMYCHLSPCKQNRRSLHSPFSLQKESPTEKEKMKGR